MVVITLNMKFEQHLGLNATIIAVLAFILYYFSKWNISNLNLYHLVIVFFIFSNLPDIDHSNAKISRVFTFSFFTVGLFGVSLLLNKNILTGVFLILLAGLVIIYHLKIAEDSKDHRKFPHSFTFGFFTSLIAWYFTSFLISAIGFLCFVLHIIADNHISDAINRDIQFWKKPNIKAILNRS